MKPSSMKLLNRFRAIIFIFFIVSSVQCSKYLGETEEYTVNSPAAGTQVVPVSGSAATGQMVGAYTSNKNMLSGTISWSGLSGAPTAIHFHGPAIAGRNNRFELITLIKVPASATGSVSFESPFTEVQESWLESGQFYFDIHTAAKPNGEIRGQVILQ